MAHKLRGAGSRAATIFLCALVAGCGGGGGGGTRASFAANTNPVTLSFLIPSASAVAANSRKPAFISTLTASIAVTAYASSAQQPSTPTTVANVGPGLPGCTTAAGGTTCSVTVNAPPGNDTFVITAYAGQNGTGSALSQATIMQNVVAGMAPLSVTLSAIGASVTGDMLGYLPSRTWTYTVNSGSAANGGYGYGSYGYSGYSGYGVGGGPFVVGIYADPTVTSGIRTFVAFVAPNGSTNPFSPQTEITTNSFAAGAMGVQSTANGYLVSSYGSVSNFSFGTIPGTPMLVPSSLQLGQSWNPLANSPMSLGVSVTATVTAVGQVPGMAFCPSSPAAGASVRYTIVPLGNTTTNSSVSYVPGCGITDYIASTGIESMLSAVGSQSLGQLDITRRTESATLLGTLHTLWQHIFVKH